ncbi:GlgB N-terminal domain-containing protein, partial [Polymorphobacter multimanifer]
MARNSLSAATAALLESRLDDPFAVLGAHDGEVRTFQPGAEALSLIARDDGRPLGTLEESAPGLFVGRLAETVPYALRIAWPGGAMQETEDAYGFGLVLGELDLHLFNEGLHLELGQVMGAHPRQMDGIDGVAFSVWAPNARRVSVVGDFNG